jgi:uncharacterized membrane-anchored protein
VSVCRRVARDGGLGLRTTATSALSLTVILVLVVALSVNRRRPGSALTAGIDFEPAS